MEHEMQIPPRHPSTALDEDFDEILHTDVSAPPPPPPPPRKGGNGNNLNERRTMEQQHNPQGPPSPGFGHRQLSQKSPSRQHQREPLNSLTSSQRVSHGPHTPKSQSGCDSSVQHSEMSFASSKPDASGSVTMQTPTMKNKIPNRPSSKPPKPPTPAGSLSIEYSSRIDSFHQCMLDNIEKETMMIRNQGSFQIHEKHLTNNKASRRHSSNNHQGSRNQDDETSENRNGSETPKRRTSPSNRTGSAPATTTMVRVHSNVSLLKETMNDISVAAASTMEHLKSAIQHTKERAAKNGVIVPVGVKLPINLNAVTNPIVCGSIDDATLAEEDYTVGFADDDESGVLSPTNTARKQQAKEKKVASDQQRSSSTGRLSRFASLDKVAPNMLRTSSGTDLVKKMSEAFKKGVVAVQDAAAAAGNQSNNNSTARTNSNNNYPQHSDEKKNDDENAWGVGHLLANAVGWEGNNDEESDDGRSRATYDTWDEENSVLRRLGSWGTVNSQFTAGTAGTTLTYDTEGASVIGSVSKAVAAAAAAKANGGVIVGPDTSNPKNGDQLMVPGTHYVPKQDAHIVDDDGSLIDPALIEATIKKKEKLNKGRRRRKKLVKFDYPPIKSLRQYTRPDPEDLPNLFFTEEELDQIEDDRYSTMSSDDIEIVAVSSAERKDRDDAIDEKLASKKKKSPRNSSEGNRKEPDYEPGCKPVKGRSGTPDRRRTCDSDSSQKKSPKNSEETDQEQTTKSPPRRLVKGVQIYLRERSTGT